MAGGKPKENNTKKTIAVRMGSSVIWLDADLEKLPQKEKIRHRNNKLSKKYDPDREYA